MTAWRTTLTKSLALLATLGACMPAAEAAIQSAVSMHNLVVFGDWTAGSNVAGTAVIGGNVLGNATDIGVGNTFALSPGETVLTVVGSVNNSNINVQKGSVQIGGNLVSNVNLNQSGNSMQAGGSITGNVNGSGKTVTANTGVVPDVAGLFSLLKSESAAFAALTANSALSKPNTNQTIFVASPSGPNNAAVFNVSFADLFGNQNANLQLQLNGADEVIINVSGAGGQILNNVNNGFNNPFDVRSKVLWNFYEATSLQLDRTLYGSVLAPFAAVTNTAVLEGSLVAATFNQRSQVHLPGVTVSSPLPPPPPAADAPEPGMASIFGGLAALAASVFWRHNRVAVRV